MMDLACMFQNAVVVTLLSTLLKILLFPAYASTDFEVHRNWLAITYNLPHELWYYEATSEWTLDYPPLFAWFEYFLSHIAVLFDPKMLVLQNLKYKSLETIWFQRGSVVVGDALLLYSAYRCGRTLTKQPLKSQNGNTGNGVQIIFFILIAFNCGLLIVDHIHFQYNGFLFGVLFLSLTNLVEGSILWGSFWFAVLLNMKHIFLYIAPAYGIFLLRTYCMDKAKPVLDAIKSFSIKNFVVLATIVCIVFSFSFGPFMYQLPQVASRLFPFKRGLTHAYWAPNFWALYNFYDKLLVVACRKYGFLIVNHNSSMTSGLVQNVEHAVLPAIPPIATFLLTFCAMLPSLIKMWMQPFTSSSNSIRQFLRCVVLCSLNSFLFGWHVHEKAILMVILPLTFLAFYGNKEDARIFLILQTAGHYSLFPLLFTEFEIVIKICITLSYVIFAFCSLAQIYPDKYKSSSNFVVLPIVNKLETAYIYGLVLVEIFCLIQPFSRLKHFAYLPLMLTSVYCSFGIIWSWFLLYKQMLADGGLSKEMQSASKHPAES